MKPLEFYHLGVNGISSATSEAQQRTLVGRVYYGLHHEACCRYFRENPNASPLSRHSRHSELCRRFNTLTGVIAKQIGNLLNDLRVLRTQADYELVKLEFRGQLLSSSQLVITAIAVGQQLLHQLDLYSPGEAPDGCDCPTAW